MRNKDYYKILQVDPAAEPEVIAAAYRRLSLKYHPDTNKAANATARMQEINEAYEVLKEPGKRLQYDRERSAQTPSYTHPEDGTWREKAEAGGRRWGEAASQHGAAEADRQTIHAFRAVPRGARAVKAFSPEQVYCDSHFFQEHTVPGSCWIDLGFKWIAREVATVVTTWPFLTMAVTVDGEEIDNPKQQSKGPDKAVLSCTNETRIGYVMANALYIPPLPLGDHTVIWTISFARDINDGWHTYPRGKELVVTSRLHVVKAV
jgi:hypothetical protein